MDHGLKENAVQMLGIDIGTFALKAVILDQEGHIMWKRSVPHRNKVKKALLEVLDTLGGKEYCVGICGSMKRLAGLEDCSFHEILCLCRAQGIQSMGTNSIIHLGAQKTYYIVLQDGKKPQIYQNSNCSSGTVIKRTAVTGSGREYIAGQIGADLAVNEITAPLTDERIIFLAQQHTVEEICYLVKLVHGHIAWLMEQVFHFKDRGITLISPELSLDFGMRFMVDSILSMARPSAYRGQPWFPVRLRA